MHYHGSFTRFPSTAFFNQLAERLGAKLSSSPPSPAYMRRWTGSALLQMMACRLDGTKPLSESILIYCQLDPKECISIKFYLKFKYFHSRKMHLNKYFHSRKCQVLSIKRMRRQNGDHVVQGRWVKCFAYRTTLKNTRYIVKICTICRHWHSALYISLLLAWLHEEPTHHETWHRTISHWISRCLD